MDLNYLMQQLALERLIFHSEADFQHALAWKIHQLYPEFGVRLEVEKGNQDTGLKHIDLLVTEKKLQTAIELKYKTKGFDCTISNENYHLKNHYAHDCARYDFIKDVVRLESYVQDGSSRKGYAVFLTNDHLYWDEPRRDDVFGIQFRIHEGRELHGDLDWAEGTSPGTKAGREIALNIAEQYKIQWKNYSKVNTVNQEQYVFRYCCVSIG